MNATQYHYQNGQWQPALSQHKSAQWVLLFGDRNLITDPEIKLALGKNFPKAQRMGCTTSGEIASEQVFDQSLVATVIEFDKTEVHAGKVNIEDFSSIDDAVKALAQSIPQSNLKYAMVLSDGQKVNGSVLVDGLKDYFAKEVLITGGLAGDDDRFEETRLWLNEVSESGSIIICGLYGDSINIGHGSVGGWDAFGPSRMITKSENNVLYELDGKNALALYKEYLGDYAKELPASALLFPLAVSREEGGDAVVRTILNIDEEHQTLTFAGNLPEGHFTQLMRANFDRLIDGASIAASHSLQPLNSEEASVAILVSCVGRRLVLGQRVEEELEEIRERLGDHCILSGFYSYGEISPLKDSVDCHLHNQTMTVTTFSEN